MEIEKLPLQCGAKLRRKNAYCRKAPMTNGRCDLHGGKTPVGAASPQFKHGRYSKHIPKNMDATFGLALTDEDLTNLRSEIALIDAFTDDRLERIYKNGESLDKYKMLSSLLSDLIEELGDDKPNAKRIALTMRATVQQGIKEYKAFEQLAPLIEQRRKLVESEAKRLRDLGQNIPLSHAIGLVARLGSIVEKYVADMDPVRARALTQELNELIS